MLSNSTDPPLDTIKFEAGVLALDLETPVKCIVLSSFLSHKLQPVESLDHWLYSMQGNI